MVAFGERLPDFCHHGAGFDKHDGFAALGRALGNDLHAAVGAEIQEFVLVDAQPEAAALVRYERVAGEKGHALRRLKGVAAALDAAGAGQLQQGDLASAVRVSGGAAEQRQGENEDKQQRKRVPELDGMGSYLYLSHAFSLSFVCFDTTISGCQSQRISDRFRYKICILQDIDHEKV